jgi:hypothetical protein
MPEHYNAGDRMPEGVLLVDAATGQPIPTSALGGVTLAELLEAVLPVAPNVSRGGGAVDANTQRVTAASDSPDVVALAAIDSKTPALVNGATPVGATPRVCLGNHTLTIATGTAVTLLQAMQAATPGATIPAGAVVAELQPKNGSINVSRFAGTTPTATVGLQIDALVNQPIDTVLADVKMIAITASVTVNCSFFDRV